MFSFVFDIVYMIICFAFVVFRSCKSYGGRIWMVVLMFCEILLERVVLFVGKSY